MGGIWMYSILLVDDERIELETLRDYVNWESMDIGSVHAVRNGKQAIEYISEHRPDIVITDIQMPSMDGIQLAKEIRKQKYNTKIVFLTGYDDFEYIKAAFQVEAIDYILKPFSVESIHEVMERTKLLIDQERMVKDAKQTTINQLLERICLAGSIPQDSLLLQLDKLMDIPHHQIKYGMIAVYGNILEDETNRMKMKFPEIYHAIHHKDITVFLICDYVNFKDEANRIQSYFIDEIFTVLYTENSIIAENMRETFQNFLRLITTVFYLNDRKVANQTELIQNLPTSQPVTQESELLKLFPELKREIIKGNTWKVKEIVSEYLNKLVGVDVKDITYYIDKLYNFLNNQIVEEESQLRKRMKDDMLQWNERRGKIHHFNELSGLFYEYLETIAFWFEEKNKNPNYYVVSYVKDYVEANYQNQINIDYMAEGIRLSPNYLRSIFKENTGQTIGEFIKEYRFGCACELLKDKTLKIKEISRLVGYEDFSYFCASFTKQFWESPNEYRKRF